MNFVRGVLLAFGVMALVHLLVFVALLDLLA